MIPEVPCSGGRRKDKSDKLEVRSEKEKVLSKERQRERERERKTDRDRERHIERQREREREREREITAHANFVVQGNVYTTQSNKIKTMRTVLL